jgi:DNA-binding MarR family transcriptional regulator
MASIIGVLEGFTRAAYRDLVVSVHERHQAGPGQEAVAASDPANDAWRRLTDLFLARKQQVMEIASAHQLNPGAMNALLFLEPGQPCSMRTLADAWKCDASNVTWLVDRLEEHGLAERRPHASDRRVRTVALTRKGVKMRAQIEGKLFEAPKSFRDLSPSELQTLNKILQKLSTDSPA